MAENDKAPEGRSARSKDAPAPEEYDALAAQEAAIEERDKGAEHYMDNAVDVRDAGNDERRGAQKPVEESTTLEALHDTSDLDATPHWLQRVPLAPGRKPV